MKTTGLNPQDLQTLYYLVGFLVVSNFGTILGWIKTRDKGLAKDIKEIDQKIHELNLQLARFEGSLNAVLSQISAVPKIQEDLNRLYGKIEN